jgi:hypothetical protein
MNNLQVLALAVVLIGLSGISAADAQSSDSTQKPIDHFDKLTLERTICFGWCPIYRVVIHGDGRVEYEGEDYVKVVGRATNKLSSQQIAQIVTAINDAKYFSLRDRYEYEDDGCPMSVTDSPSVITSVTVGATTKTIHHYYGCVEPHEQGQPWQVFPRELTAFDTRIDEIVGTARWVGTEQERRKMIERQQRAPN